MPGILLSNTSTHYHLRHCLPSVNHFGSRWGKLSTTSTSSLTLTTPISPGPVILRRRGRASCGPWLTSHAAGWSDWWSGSWCCNTWWWCPSTTWAPRHYIAATQWMSISALEVCWVSKKPAPQHPRKVSHIYSWDAIWHVNSLEEIQQLKQKTRQQSTCPAHIGTHCNGLNT